MVQGLSPLKIWVPLNCWTRPAVGSIKDTFDKYTHLSTLLPAMGCGKSQIAELEETINNSPAEVVVIGTPIDLRRVMKLTKPAVRVKYELEEADTPQLKELLRNCCKKQV